ncbi:MAG TPA: WG repeat-containing protein [Chitinophagaceae bacterium]|nr:WG repeat-containing protein [Chitinophagaceae bacterium]
MSSLFLIMTLFSFAFAGCTSRDKSAPSADKDHLTPWLATNGRFGFVDSVGKLVIQPEYSDVRLFKNGFAVVKKDGKYGVINTKNEVVVPFKYAAAEIEDRGGYTFLVTKKEYNAWWNFWEWKIWPGLSFLGSSTGPFLLTKVPKAQWEVRTLPQRQKLYSKRKLDFDLGVSYWNKGWQPSRYIPENLKPNRLTRHYFRLGKRFYRIAKNEKLKKQSGKMVKLLNDSTFIYRKGKQYYVENAEGKILQHKRYTKEDKLFTQTFSGDRIVIPVKNPDMPPYRIIQHPLYKDDSGHFYIYPAMDMAFPSEVGDYKHDTIEVPGNEILKAAVLVSPWNEDDFLILSFAGSKRGYRVYFLNRNGQWENSMPNYNNIVPNHSSRDLVIIHGKQFLSIDDQFHIKKFPGDFIPIWGHSDWYFVKDAASQKYGLYHLKEQKWLIEPKYYALETTAQPDVAIYSVEAKDSTHKTVKYGLLNMETQKEITPPIYHWIEEDGRVRISGKEKNIEFYIDLKTGREYRDKE